MLDISRSKSGPTMILVRRALAFAVDSLNVALLGLGLLGLFSNSLPFVCAAYFIFSEGRYGQTLGKRWFKLRVTRMDGDRPSYEAAAGRSFVPVLFWILAGYAFNTSHYLSGLVGMSFIFIVGVADGSIALLSGHRCLHDSLTGTQVVAANKEREGWVPSPWESGGFALLVQGAAVLVAFGLFLVFGLHIDR
jgi:uncharacterized RDD family membrane protein YckC